MKQFSKINESKEKPLYSEFDIHTYFNYCLTKWLDNMRGYSLTTINGYNLVQMCKQCEIGLYLIEKFADDINLHFYSAESESDRKTYGGYTTMEDSVLKTFKIIEQVSKVDFSDMSYNDNKTVDVESEINELKNRFKSLVKKCNDKYKKHFADVAKSKMCAVGVPCETIPCGTECDCACGCAC